MNLSFNNLSKREARKSLPLFNWSTLMQFLLLEKCCKKGGLVDLARMYFIESEQKEMNLIAKIRLNGNSYVRVKGHFNSYINKDFKRTI